MELCVLIPAKNEEFSLTKTIANIQEELKENVSFNILVIDDHSSDGTLGVLGKLATTYDNLQYISNKWEGGVGNAIKYGLSRWEGDIVAMCMADASDSPEDIRLCYLKIAEEGYDCAFGSRFIQGAHVENYPFIKLIMNRIFNNMVRVVSGNRYDDYTNIFKVYNRHAISAIEPLVSKGFSIGLEMSLKSFKKNLNIAVIPISWKNRAAGSSKLSIVKNFRPYMSILRKSLKDEYQ